MEQEKQYTIANMGLQDIIFFSKDRVEILRLCSNGDIHVRGKLIENDREVVQGLRDFLGSARK
jgi:hypothetical protein